MNSISFQNSIQIIFFFPGILFPLQNIVVCSSLLKRNLIFSFQKKKNSKKNSETKIDMGKYEWSIKTDKV